LLLLIGARGGSSEWVPCRRQGIEEWRRFLPWNRRLHGAREAGTLTLAQRHGPGILPVGVHRTFARRAERAGLVNRGCWLTVHDVCRGAFMDWGVQQSRHRELEARTGQVEECWGGASCRSSSLPVRAKYIRVRDGFPSWVAAARVEKQEVVASLKASVCLLIPLK